MLKRGMFWFLLVLFSANANDIPMYNLVEHFYASVNSQDNASAFQSAINAGKETGKPIFIPNGTYKVSSVLLESNVRFIGESSSECIIKAVDNSKGGVFTNYERRTQQLENVTFENICFDGNRESIESSIPEHSIIHLEFMNNGYIKNLNVRNCIFTNYEKRGIHIKQISLPLEGEPLSNNVSVINCSFYGGDNQSIEEYPGSAIRVEMDYSLPYGNYFISNIKIDSCYAEKIRTLADIKRGCADFYITNCTTKDIYDCHHSIDGAKWGLVDRCSGEMSTDFTPYSGTNFIEIQGEEITVSRLFFDGNMKLMRGIQIQDHFTEPDETEVGGNKLGHVSNNITVNKCTVKNVSNIGIKFTNAHNSVIKNCIIENSIDQSIAVESGTGNTDINGIKLTSSSVILCGNKAVNCGKGFTVQGENNILLGDNFSHDNIAFFDNGDYRLFRRTFNSFYTGQQWTELNPNPGLILNSEGTRIRNWETGHEVVTYDIVDKPEGTTGSVILTDDTPWAIGEVELDTKIECTASEVLHLRVFAKKADQNTKFSIVFAEFDSDTYLGAKYMFSHELSDTWNEFYCNFIPENSATNQIKIKICPSSVEYNKSDVGKVKMASLNISKTPIGMK